MVHSLKDRVKETTTTSGTSTIDLGGATDGFQSFLGAGYSDNDTAYYTIVNSTNWEVGMGTLSSSVTKLARTTIFASSNSDAAISLTGSSEVFVTHPADRTTHTVPSHPPSASGIAFWHSTNAVGHDHSLVWESGVNDKKLTVSGKTNTKSSYTPNKINTDGSTVTFDCNESNLHSVVLGGNRVLATTNVDIGQKFVVRLEQDATGSRTVTWFDHLKWAEGGVAPSLTSTANKTDVFGFIAASGTGSSYWYDGFVIGQNI